MEKSSFSGLTPRGVAEHMISLGWGRDIINKNMRFIGVDKNYEETRNKVIENLKLFG